MVITSAMTTTAIRNKLYDYIRVADEKKLQAIYHLLEGEIEQVSEWWKDKKFVSELDNRYAALEQGADKGYTISQLQASVEKHKQKKHGK